MSTSELRAIHPSDDCLWTPEDVALYLKLSESWVYHAAQRGELPCLRISRTLRFEPEAIRAWVRGGRHLGAKTEPRLQLAAIGDHT